DWGNFQETSCNILNHIPFVFQQEVQAGNKLEANTLGLLQDEFEEQVFDDCLDDEVEYYWKQIDEHNWRMAWKMRTTATLIELHTVE
ncbi:hypothetical protein, partial [Alteromonas stellipolaris]|uniref:hypothetical protein n=1 Tax=Alteromonas stellipolaris TaxID=233316 RepID=UPI001D214549